MVILSHLKNTLTATAEVMLGCAPNRGQTFLRFIKFHKTVDRRFVHQHPSPATLLALLNIRSNSFYDHPIWFRYHRVVTLSYCQRCIVRTWAYLTNWSLETKISEAVSLKRSKLQLFVTWAQLAPQSPIKAKLVVKQDLTFHCLSTIMQFFEAGSEFWLQIGGGGKFWLQTKMKTGGRLEIACHSLPSHHRIPFS